MKIPELDGIIKFITSMYEPLNIEVKNKIYDKGTSFELNSTIIEVYFKGIGSSDLLERSKLIDKITNNIRKDIKNYFGLNTSGYDFLGYGPFVHRTLTIKVEFID